MARSNVFAAVGMAVFLTVAGSPVNGQDPCYICGVESPYEWWVCFDPAIQGWTECRVQEFGCEYRGLMCVGDMVTVGMDGVVNSSYENEESGYNSGSVQLPDCLVRELTLHSATSYAAGHDGEGGLRLATIVLATNDRP